MIASRRLGPLAEREFRLLFLARGTSFLGSAMAPVAIAFAVLDLAGPTQLGIVLAARQIPQVVLLLVGGVWADRLPRNVVMVGANVASGGAQLVIAVLLLTNTAEIWQLAALAGVNGAASAFFFPASQGIVPQTVSAENLQQANVLLRMGTNATMIGGAAAGGLAVAAVGTGWAIAFDGLTYLASAAILVAMRVPRRARVEGATVLHDLREGWREFSSRTWLWVIVAAFGFINAAHGGARDVIGPLVAKRELGGAGAYGLIVASSGIGLVVGGLLALRWRPSRLLFVGSAAVLLEIPLIALFALAPPLLLLVAAAVLAGIGIELFGVFWDTALQQNIPGEALSRVYAYDALGSFVLIPAGLAVAGPSAEAIGVDATLWVFAAVVAGCTVAMLAVRDVRTIRRQPLPRPA